MQTASTTTVLTISVQANRAPTLNAIANMTVNENATADQVITGTDADANALTFTKAAGPTFMTVTTTNATTGNIHLAPGILGLWDVRGDGNGHRQWHTASERQQGR